MSTSLQSAIESLRINDVYQRAATSVLADGFEPKYDSDLDRLQIQFKHIVSRSEILSLEDEEGAQQLFRVYVDLGARWVLPSQDNTSEERARIEGTMVAEYQMDNHPGDEALNAFALKNASFHVWPYWREFLSAQCLRMNLPKLTLPTIQFAANRDR